MRRGSHWTRQGRQAGRAARSRGPRLCPAGAVASGRTRRAPGPAKGATAAATAARCGLGSCQTALYAECISLDTQRSSQVDCSTVQPDGTMLQSVCDVPDTLPPSCEMHGFLYWMLRDVCWAQGSPESSSFSLSSRHWGHHMQPSWSDAELSLPASL